MSRAVWVLAAGLALVGALWASEDGWLVQAVASAPLAWLLVRHPTWRALYALPLALILLAHVLGAFIPDCGAAGQPSCVDDSLTRAHDFAGFLGIRVGLPLVALALAADAIILAMRRRSPERRGAAAATPRG